MNDNALEQPIGRSGLDPLQQQPIDPIRTFETPYVYFPAEIVVPINSVMQIPLPPRCGQIAFINLVPNVVASFNGGGGRTIKDGFVMNGVFNSLQVATDGTGTCTIQLACF
jgi:hypothetical protein